MFDLIIIGSGPAGLTAGIYAARYKINHLIISQTAGGLATTADQVENWPGEISIKGADLMNKIKTQAEKLGSKIAQEQVIELAKKNNDWLVKTAKKEYQAKSLILALGTTPGKLAIPGEKEFLGKGVSYCATCDGMFFKNKIVAVVGGSDCAVTEALFLSDICQKVYIIYRREQLRCEAVWLDKIKNRDNAEVIINAQPKKIVGRSKVEKLVLNNGRELAVAGVFVNIGAAPDSGLAKKIGVKLDKEGYIKVRADQQTNLAGVFAAGDVTTGSNKLRQMLTAAAEGAVAANEVKEYLQKT